MRASVDAGTGQGCGVRDGSAMHKLSASRVPPSRSVSMAWLRAVVRPLLCSTGGVGAALSASARGHAGLHCPPAWSAHTGAGAVLLGCALSEDELRIAERYGNEPASWEG